MTVNKECKEECETPIIRGKLRAKARARLEGVKCNSDQLHREDLPIEWDVKKHGEGTEVILKSDGRRGVSTMDRDRDGGIKVRFEDDGSESGYIKTDDVWASHRWVVPTYGHD